MFSRAVCSQSRTSLFLRVADHFWFRGGSEILLPEKTLKISAGGRTFPCTVLVSWLFTWFPQLLMALDQPCCLLRSIQGWDVTPLCPLGPALPLSPSLGGRCGQGSPSPAVFCALLSCFISKHTVSLLPCLFIKCLFCHWYNYHPDLFSTGHSSVYFCKKFWQLPCILKCLKAFICLLIKGTQSVAKVGMG